MNTDWNAAHAQLEDAVRRNEVSFEQLLQCHYGATRAAREEDRITYREFYPEVFDAFQKRHGSIQRSYFCKTCIGAIVWTSTEEVFCLLNALDVPEVDDLLDSCHYLKIEAKEHLRGKDRKIVLEMLYNAMVTCVALVGQRDELSKAATTAQIEQIRTEISYMSDRLARLGQRNARFHYFIGMLTGLLLVLASVVTIDRLVFTDSEKMPYLGSSLLAGAVGAVISVLVRMTRNALVLSYDVGSGHLRLLGGFRPVVGAVFGAALHFMLASNVLPIKVMLESDQLEYFYPFVGFLAGFSERWAQDMFGMARGQLATPGGSQIAGKEPTNPAPDDNSSTAPN